MIVWFLVMFWATNKGVRLIVFLLIPMGVMLGAGLESLFGWAREKGRLWRWAVFAGLSILLGALMFNNGRQAAAGSFPLIDDRWYSVLSTIKEKTPRDAVINSWWDFGDWFKTVGGRKVIFDGQSQNTPQGYWMARALLATDEKKAVAILRMLNNGGNMAFELIDGHLHNPLRSITLLEKVLGAPRHDAEKTLMAVLPRPVTGRLLHILYGTPPPAYFVVDYTMPSKMPPISFIGNWDFLKVYLSKNCRARPQSEVVAELNSAGIPVERAESLYRSARYLPKKGLDDWISTRYHYYVSSNSVDEQGGLVYFNSGVVWDTGGDSARSFDSYHGKFARPEVLFIARNGTIEEKRFEKNDGPGAILLYKEGDKYRSIQMDIPLGRCLFTRLYYLRGAGLSHFSLFTQSDEDGRVIRVYEIDWKVK
jgi:dolichyl-diphosphooligosaccharide--protein glycosyltransferase